MFGNASQGGEQADQQISADFDTLGMLGSLIAFLWSDLQPDGSYGSGGTHMGHLLNDYIRRNLRRDWE